MPKFATSFAKAKVEKLMQPALIRVIDNIRKQLDTVAWKGTYEEELIWPEGTTPEQKQEYTALMSAMPQPAPLYTLRLTHADSEDQTIDVWGLCYRVCALAYGADSEQEIAADDALFDEFGEVDWRLLDDKTKSLVEGIFAKLPA